LPERFCVSTTTARSRRQSVSRVRPMRDRRFGLTGAVTRRGSIFNQGTNLLWETEHGPSGFDGPGGGDEVNIIERGKNYGWPVIHHRATQAGMESPVP
jgi:glucose/arabinose dehydrogenase